MNPSESFSSEVAFSRFSSIVLNTAFLNLRDAFEEAGLVFLRSAYFLVINAFNFSLSLIFSHSFIVYDFCIASYTRQSKWTPSACSNFDRSISTKNTL